MSTGQLYISLDPDADAAVVPVEVRRADLHVVARTLSSERVEVEPGAYFVSGNLPDGREVRGRVEVAAGATVDVELKLDPVAETLPPPAPAPSEPAPSAAPSPPAPTATRSPSPAPAASPSKSAPLRKMAVRKMTDQLLRWIEQIGSGPYLGRGSGGWAGSEAAEAEATAAAESEAESFEAAPPEAAAPDEDVLHVKLRAFSGNVLREALEPNAVTALESVDRRKEGLVRLQSYASPNLTVQLLQPGFPALNAVLMPTGSDIVLHPPAHAGAPWRLAIRLENARESLLLQYIERGAVKQAAVVAQSPGSMAESALMHKMAAPIPAALGAYVLLRTGELDRLHNWTTNLKNWVDWLPDGVSILAEHLARQGKHAEALAVLLELPERGLPAFSDGLTYAVDRLRLYTEHADRFDAAAVERARSALDQLRTFSAYADFTYPGLTYTGLDPAQPDARPLSEEEIAAVEGFAVAVPRSA